MTPTGYEPDSNHGSIEEFKQMGLRLKAKNIPWLVWMSYNGVQPGAKGIFFDCLGWAFPPDFAPRDFMRFPGDTKRMAIVFMEEIYSCIKECDPDAILMGEGTTLDGPCNIFSIAGNPVGALDGIGPRDFFLGLNRYSQKKFIVDQGGNYFPASGMNPVRVEAGMEERNRFYTHLLSERGGREALVHLPGDVSILPDYEGGAMLFVALAGEMPPHTERPASRRELRLPPPFENWRDYLALLRWDAGKMAPFEKCNPVSTR